MINCRVDSSQIGSNTRLIANYTKLSSLFGGGLFVSEERAFIWIVSDMVDLQVLEVLLHLDFARTILIAVRDYAVQVQDSQAMFDGDSW